MIAFAEAAQAVRCAVEIERALARRRVHSPRSWCASASTTGRPCTATTTSSAATSHSRRASPDLAEGGEILVSGDVVEQIAHDDELDLMLTLPRLVPAAGLACEQAVASVDWAA